MKLNIDVLMIILLVAFVGSFVALIVYGEVWRIRLPTTDAPIESYDLGRTQIGFIASCICVASGACMFYITETKFSKDETREDSTAKSLNS
jgi:hypothetical protein